MKPIYLDYNASTPIAQEVAEAMRPFVTEHFGNPSSHHWAGAPAKAALEQARARVATLLGCAVNEVVFTSGGTEWSSNRSCTAQDMNWDGALALRTSCSMSRSAPPASWQQRSWNRAEGMIKQALTHKCPLRSKFCLQKQTSRMSRFAEALRRNLHDSNGPRGTLPSRRIGVGSDLESVTPPSNWLQVQA